MTSHAPNRHAGIGIPAPADDATGANVAGLAADQARRLDTLRARIKLAEAAGQHDRAYALRVRVLELRGLVTPEQSRDWTTTPSPTGPTAPSPTEDGRMTTVTTERDREHHTDTKPNTVSKVYPIRVNMELMSSAAEKARTEGLGVNALVDRLLREYLDPADGE